MNFLAKITLPVEYGNKFVRDSEFNQKMDRLISDLHPKTSYYCVEGGQRTIYAHVELNNSYDLPKVTEPFWLAFNADVELIPAMTQEEYGKSWSAIGEIAKKYK